MGAAARRHAAARVAALTIVEPSPEATTSPDIVPAPKSATPSSVANEAESGGALEAEASASASAASPSQARQAPTQGKQHGGNNPRR